MECLICQGKILTDEKIKICDSCKNNFHLECWTENGGCGTPGCINLPIIDKKQEGGTKICPACSESINISELICPFCKERFETIVPISAEELKGGIPLAATSAQIEGRKEVISILIFGLLGLTAPVVLLIGGIWYSKNKKKLKELSPVYNVLALVGISISVFYSLLIVIGIIFG